MQQPRPATERGGGALTPGGCRACRARCEGPAQWRHGERRGEPTSGARRSGCCRLRLAQVPRVQGNAVRALAGKGCTSALVSLPTHTGQAACTGRIKLAAAEKNPAVALCDSDGISEAPAKHRQAHQAKYVGKEGGRAVLHVSAKDDECQPVVTGHARACNCAQVRAFWRGGKAVR